MPMITD